MILAGNADRLRWSSQSPTGPAKAPGKGGKGLMGACLASAVNDYQNCLDARDKDLQRGIKTAQGLKCKKDRDEYENQSWREYGFGVAECVATYAADSLRCMLPF